MRNYSPRFTFLTLLALAIPSLAMAQAATRPLTATPVGNAADHFAYALIDTSIGEIVVELDESHAPQTVANFLAYVDKKFYDNTIFHRVLAGSLIQGGGYTADLTVKPADKPIETEWQKGGESLRNERGTIAMARRLGEPNSTTSQFFINVVDNRQFDEPQSDGAAYVVFGRVIAGMKVVDAIRFVEVNAKPPEHEAVPTQPVTIKGVRVLSQAEALAKAEADRPRRRVPRDPVPERAPAPKPPPSAAPAQPDAPVKPAPVQPDGQKPAASEPAQGQAVEYVLMTTSRGDVVLELDREHAPISVANFLAYVDKKFYDGTIFHRVMPGFMIQGGGFTPDMQQKVADKPIRNEWQNGLKNTRGSLAMARLGGNPDSASCQFFINVVDNAGLDRPQPDGAGYAVFGKVIGGMPTVDSIRQVPTGNRGGHQNVPVEPITIQSMKRLTYDEASLKVREIGNG